MPFDPRAFLREMIQLPGPSGYEGQIRIRLEREWSPLVDDISTSQVGNLYGVKSGTGALPRPSVLLAAHMDSIGLIVSAIRNGFLQIEQVGSFDPRILPGKLVTVHARRQLLGQVFRPPDSCLPQFARDGQLSLKYLLVDVGLPEDELKEIVRPGDLITLFNPAEEIGDDLLCGHALDNRASLAVLTSCLHALREHPVGLDVVAVATTQEEESALGALNAAYSLRPSIAIAIDVTYGRAPGVADHEAFALGKGPVIGRGPNIHPEIFNALEGLWKQEGHSPQIEIMPGSSGTDAETMQTAAEGVPTGLISIPTRYLHSPIETASIQDIEAAGELLTQFLRKLDADFLKQLAGVHSYD